MENIEVDRPIGVYFQQVEDAIQFTQDRKTPFTPTRIVQTAYHAVNKKVLYSQDLKDWQKRQPQTRHENFQASLLKC